MFFFFQARSRERSSNLAWFWQGEFAIRGGRWSGVRGCPRTGRCGSGRSLGSALGGCGWWEGTRRGGEARRCHALRGNGSRGNSAAKGRGRVHGRGREGGDHVASVLEARRPPALLAA